jgi:hypothetical protein
MFQYAFVALLAFVAAPAAIEGGGYRGKPHAPVAPERWFYNHEPVPVLSSNKLPKRFDW